MRVRPGFVRLLQVLILFAVKTWNGIKKQKKVQYKSVIARTAGLYKNQRYKRLAALNDYPIARCMVVIACCSLGQWDRLLGHGVAHQNAWIRILSFLGTSLSLSLSLGSIPKVKPCPHPIPHVLRPIEFCTSHATFWPILSIISINFTVGKSGPS